MAGKHRNDEPTEVEAQPMAPAQSQEIERSDGAQRGVSVYGGGRELTQFIRENVGPQGIKPLDLPRIKMPAAGGLAWTIPTLEGPEPSRFIEGVVVSWQTRRAYWEKSFGATGGGSPPDCSSEDGDIGVGWNGTDPPTDQPDLDVYFDANGRPVFAHDCSTCPLGGANAWGTARDDKGEPTPGKACKEIRALYVRRPGDLLPFMVPLPPSSLKNCAQFFLRMASAELSYYGVVMQIGLEEAKNARATFSRATFAIARRLDPQEQAEVMEYRGAITAALGAQVIDYAELARDAGIAEGGDE